MSYIKVHLFRASASAYLCKYGGWKKYEFHDSGDVNKVNRMKCKYQTKFSWVAPKLWDYVFSSIRTQKYSLKVVNIQIT